MPLKILYYSDCDFFGGCEQMLVNFWRSDVLRREYQLNFCYRNTKRYTDGMRAWISLDFPVVPLAFPPNHWPAGDFRFPFAIFSKGIRFVFRLIGRFPFFFYEAWVVFNLVRKIRPDIVHLNNGGYPGARSVRAAAVGARLAGCRSIVMVVNNLAEPYRNVDRWLDYVLDRWVVRSTTKFVTGSAATSKRLAAVLRLGSSQIQPIHNGMCVGEVSESKDLVRRRLGVPRSFSGLVLGVVALLTERKGHIFLIEALEILKRRDPDLGSKLRVWFEGEGECRERLERVIMNKNLSDIITFVDSGKNVVDLMNAIDALVLPSIDNEDFPNVVLIAMALGKGVIASRVAGIPEQIIDGETGRLVQPRDSRALAEAILDLMEHPDLAWQMGARGKKRFQDFFTAERAVGQYLELYRLMNKNGMSRVESAKEG